MSSTDYLVVGSGIAGLTFAIKMAERFSDRKIVIVTKASEEDANTAYAQGGIAIVSDMENDSFEQHFRDTLVAGDGCCDTAVVEMVVREGPQRLRDLLDWGISFDLEADGRFQLGKEGGHSVSRIIHHKDATGYRILAVLLEKVRQLSNITILEYHFAIDLISENRRCSQQAGATACHGAYVMDQRTGTVETVRAKATILATGGIGRVYGHTTNPMIATGDGIAMAYRAGAQINDMEFVQFHPTALAGASQGRSFLISEAVRGFGAYLRNKSGVRFMADLDKRAELASRDIVSRGIESEMKRSGESCVYLDATHLDVDEFKAHFPNIYGECQKRDIEIDVDWIPVAPAAHYLCGGIKVDRNGATDIDNLFALGECASTGLHGANRLASNSLLEALVFAHNSYAHLAENMMPETPEALPLWQSPDLSPVRERRSSEAELLGRLQSLMREYVGIVRSFDGLLAARDRLGPIRKEVESLYATSRVNTELCELRNLVAIAHLIIEQALKRDVNKGGHYNIDL